jgi:hypothetical protein
MVLNTIKNVYLDGLIEYFIVRVKLNKLDISVCMICMGQIIDQYWEVLMLGLMRIIRYLMIRRWVWGKVRVDVC